MKIIGIVSGKKETSHGRADGASTFYSQCVQEQGGIPILIPAGYADPSAYSHLYDALLLTGCDWDISPELYGEIPAGSRKSDLQRDLWEREVIRETLSQGKKILGICRGMQMLHVADGGRLIQDLSSHLDHEISDLSREAHSLSLHSSLHLRGREHYLVNSYHHQAIAQPTENYRVIARAPDGTIEGIESEQAIGVQWHPERLPEDPLTQELFRWLSSEG